jgi:hypothetical protein
MPKPFRQLKGFGHLIINADEVFGKHSCTPEPIFGEFWRIYPGVALCRLGSMVRLREHGVRAERTRSAQVGQRSTCSAIERASSTSMPRYLTVLSILVWPSNSCTALRLPVRR